MTENQKVWTYRVVKRNEFGGDWFSIEGVYNIGGDAPWIVDKSIGGESIEDLRCVLEQSLKALDKPVIDATTLNTNKKE